MMDYLVKLSTDAAAMTDNDAQQLRDVGFSDGEIADITLAAAARNFFSRALLAMALTWTSPKASATSCITLYWLRCSEFKCPGRAARPVALQAFEFGDRTVRRGRRPTGGPTVEGSIRRPLQPLSVDSGTPIMDLCRQSRIPSK